MLFVSPMYHSYKTANVYYVLFDDIFLRAQLYGLALITECDKIRLFRIILSLMNILCNVAIKTKLHAKFGENRTNGLGVIQVFINFKLAAGGHLGLRISRFPVTDLLRLWSRCYMWNLVQIRLTVQKLLRFFFLIGNAFTGTPKLEFWGVLGVKTEKFIFVNPKRNYLTQEHVF